MYIKADVTFKFASISEREGKLKAMEMLDRRGSNSKCVALIVLVAWCVMQINAADYHPIKKIIAETKTCTHRRSPCFLKRIQCPAQCPSSSPSDPKAKICYLDCDSPICKAQCKTRKPNCNGRGSACLDPRFVGADGIVFYFHGRRNEHFSLVSDTNLQINARFIGLRPAGRSRDYTWIQALGILFDSHKFSIEATPTATWDDEVDRLKLSYNGQELIIPQGPFSAWESPENKVRVERTSSKNSVLLTTEVAEISVNVAPVTKEDSRIHNYQIPEDDCFAHLEVQFKFHGLSPKVEGVLGRTYQPDFENPAKPGVAMAVVGGEDKYRTTSLLSADCGVCLFSPAQAFPEKITEPVMDHGMLDCRGIANSGNGIVCRR